MITPNENNQKKSLEAIIVKSVKTDQNFSSTRQIMVNSQINEHNEANHRFRANINKNLQNLDGKAKS